MKQFSLTTKSKEVIIKTSASDFQEALDYFSKVKKLPKEEILKIFYILEK